MKKRKRSSGAATSRFVIDTNIIVSALKKLLREPQERERISSLSLLVKLIVDPGKELYGDQLLLREYQRFVEGLNSEILTQILNELTGKVQTLAATS